MSPEYRYLIKANLGDVREANQVKDLLIRINGVEAVEIFEPLTQEKSFEEIVQPGNVGMDLIKLGKIFKEKRKAIGIPLSQAAKRARIDRSSLWVLERGKNPKTGKPSKPSFDKLIRLGQVLRLDKQTQGEILSLAGYSENTLI